MSIVVHSAAGTFQELLDGLADHSLNSATKVRVIDDITMGQFVTLTAAFGSVTFAGPTALSRASGTLDQLTAALSAGLIGSNGDVEVIDGATDAEMSTLSASVRSVTVRQG